MRLGTGIVRSLTPFFNVGGGVLLEEVAVPLAAVVDFEIEHGEGGIVCYDIRVRMFLKDGSRKLLCYRSFNHVSNCLCFLITKSKKDDGLGRKDVLDTHAISLFWNLIDLLEKARVGFNGRGV